MNRILIVLLALLSIKYVKKRPLNAILMCMHCASMSKYDTSCQSDRLTEVKTIKNNSMGPRKR